MTMVIVMVTIDGVAVGWSGVWMRAKDWSRIFNRNLRDRTVCGILKSWFCLCKWLRRYQIMSFYPHTAIYDIFKFFSEAISILFSVDVINIYP